jgi:hypothetical protein
MMEFKPWQKLTGRIFGIIMLGAIGSGIWARLFDPGYSKVRDVLLNIATLGIGTLKDNTYFHVAQGIHQEAALSVLLVVLMMFYVLPVFAVITLQLLNRESKDNKYSSRVLRLLRVVGRPRLLWYTAPIILTVVFLQFIQVDYCDLANVHYNQLRAIIRPTVGEAQISLFDATFAQIQSSKDYTDLLRQMEQIARTAGKRVPEFNAW